MLKSNFEALGMPSLGWGELKDQVTEQSIVGLATKT